MQTKRSLIVVLGLSMIPAMTRADSLSLVQIAQELKQDAVIPLAPSVGNQLAKNLLAAQAAAPYTQFEPDSLQLSIDATAQGDWALCLHRRTDDDHRRGERAGSLGAVPNCD